MTNYPERIVIALGGNAILTDDPSADAQIRALQKTCAYIVPLIEEGKEIIITYGNGPQVGNLLLQQEAGSSAKSPAMPLDTCVAMTQGSIGYWTVLALKTVLKRAGLDRRVDVLMTTTSVSPDDPAFKNPTKPIGPFLSEEDAKAAAAEDGCTYIEDAGRGWRKVVPSPQPIDVSLVPLAFRLWLSAAILWFVSAAAVSLLSRQRMVSVALRVSSTRTSQQRSSLRSSMPTIS